MPLVVAEIAEHSKTAFYVAGGALFGWAILVAFTGITRPDFPPGAAGRLGVIAITIALVIASMATAVITA